MSLKEKNMAQSLLTFLADAPTPFHAVQITEKSLLQAGFEPLDLSVNWKVKPGQRVFVKSNDSTIAAFEIGSMKPEDAGFRLIGAHTDSPNLRLKPNPEIKRAGTTQWTVEVYGGVLRSTWLDRDLSLAGKVCFDSEDGLKSVLVDFQRPIARIPNLAIHLSRSLSSEGLKLNSQKHLMPLVGLSSTVDSLKGALASQIDQEKKLKVQPEQILSWDLSFYDAQEPCLGGLNSEFIFSARLDNLASCHAALQALIQSNGKSAFTKGVVFYDHEECGSTSEKGAASSFLRQTLMRLMPNSSEENFSRAMSQSFFVSADMAHAVHPNYPEKHDLEHGPILGKGPVIKMNMNQSYATDAEGWAMIEKIARDESISIQKFVCRNDMRCGSTIGPVTASLLGIKTIDVGNPMLAMHSTREMAATNDVDPFLQLLTGFLDSSFSRM